MGIAFREDQTHKSNMHCTLSGSEEETFEGGMIGSLLGGWAGVSKLKVK